MAATLTKTKAIRPGPAVQGSDSAKVEITLRPSVPHAGVLTLGVTIRDSDDAGPRVRGIEFVLTREELTPVVMAFLAGST